MFSLKIARYVTWWQHTGPQKLVYDQAEDEKKNVLTESVITLGSVKMNAK